MAHFSSSGYNYVISFFVILPSAVALLSMDWSTLLEDYLLTIPNKADLACADFTVQTQKLTDSCFVPMTTTKRNIKCL